MSKRARPATVEEKEEEAVRQVAARIDAETSPGERLKQLAEAKKNKQDAVKKVGDALKEMKRLWSMREADALLATTVDLEYRVLAYQNICNLELKLMSGKL